MSIFKRKPAPCPDPFVGKVRCNTCACYIDKRDAQEVKRDYLAEYYCRIHRLPYDAVYSNRYEDKAPVFFKNTVLVDEEGTPVGYRKIK